MPQLEEEILGLVETDWELDSVEVWHPVRDGEPDGLNDPVMQLDTVTE